MSEEDGRITGMNYEEKDGLSDGFNIPRVEKSERRFAWLRQLVQYGIEERGIAPIPLGEKQDVAYSRMFTFWSSLGVNIVTFSTGSLGPLFFGLGTRDSCLVILFINLVCIIPIAYFVTIGPKLGIRQMILARYSFGYYLVILPVLFNLATLVGFNIVNSILGGQALASVATGNLSWTVGIVVVAVISLIISFMGYTVLHWYERFAWIPVAITFVIALGIDGHYLSNPVQFGPATAPSVLSFVAVLLGFMMPYVGLSADFSCYMPATAPSKRLFWYTYLGLLLTTVPLQSLGAIVGACVPNVPEWEAGYEQGSVGGLLAAMLAPAGGFGKFLMVLLALSVMGNIAATFYSISLNFQIIFPPLVRVPRYVFSIVGTAIVIPLSIAGAHRFFDTLSNFLGVIGYWAGAYATIQTLEHFLFRKGNVLNYDVAIWNQHRKLPYGAAAFFSLAAGFSIAIPAMDQVWYVGPIAKKTGDLGFELAFLTALVIYPPLRWLELRISKRPAY